MKDILLGLAFITLLPQVVGIHCYSCHSGTSWADCEKNLKVFDCDKDPGDWMCMTQRLTQDNTTLFLKGCEERRNCHPAKCNRANMCEMHCCCKDYCNNGIIGRDNDSMASFHSPAAFFVFLALFSFFAMN